MGIESYNAVAPENISRIIEQKGLKRLFVAKKAGLTSQLMTDMLNGRRLIKVCDLLRISEVLGVSVDTLCARPTPSEQGHDTA